MRIVVRFYDTIIIVTNIIGLCISIILKFVIYNMRCVQYAV